MEVFSTIYRGGIGDTARNLSQINYLEILNHVHRKIECMHSVLLNNRLPICFGSIYSIASI